MVGIYKITNQINGKSYIGQSSNIQQRWREHRTRYQQSNSSEYNSLIHKAMRKYGIENFTWEILEECSLDILNQREIYWIQYFHTWTKDNQCNGYNINPGGNHRNRIYNERVQSIIIDLQSKLLSQNEIANKYNISSNMVSLINLGKEWYNPEINYPIRRKKKINYCIDCGKEISLNATRCIECSHKKQQKRSNDLTREELKKLIRTESFVSIGKKYNVSDNSIRKWCIKFGLPTKKTEINNYSDEEWELI